MRSTTVFCLLAVLAYGASGKTIRKGPDPENHGLDEENLPENIAVYEGDNVTLSCWVDAGTVTHRMQWVEYAHHPSGGLISDGDFISPVHPQSERYSLVRGHPRQFDLHIRNIIAADGGTYECTDSLAGIFDKRRHTAEIIVITSRQNCTTTMPSPPMALVEGVYYTHECQTHYRGNIAPNMEWNGPPPFLQAQTTTPTVVWNGLSFYASRSMSGLLWVSRTNFTNNFHPVPADTADNIPEFEEYYETERVTVNWSPQSMYATPVKDDYVVGDVVECFADAFPTAVFEWHNTRTNERFSNSLFIIPLTWQGTEQLMRCIASNVINGQPQTNEYFIRVNVPDPTTTPPPTTPTTTTTAPPVSNCLDLSGRWESVSPTPGLMCLEINPDNGGINGVLRNSTDTFWLDIVGTTDVGSYHHASWTAIWPLNRAVSSFIAECSRCNGVEVLLVNVISRTKGGPPCGTPGLIQYSAQYEFKRAAVTSCPPVTMPT